MSFTITLAALVLAAGPAHRVDANGYLDKVTVGYHGAFATPKDGAQAGWGRWAEATPARGAAAVELYPDTREYAADDLATTGLAPLGSGAPAQLFSSYSPRVVDTHFRWLEEAGLDGVGLERLLTDTADPRALARRNELTRHVRAAAEAHGRVFYVAYDLSGAPEAGWAEQLQRDWTAVLQGQLHLTDSPAYVREGGRPVVVLRGLGVPGGPGTVAETMDVIDWFKAQGCYVVGGVPAGWRTGEGTRPNFLSAYARLDAVQPWAVGAFSDEAGAQDFVERVVRPDQAFAAQLGVAYQQVLFPGLASSNAKGGARNAVPRRAGRFFWAQAWLARRDQVSVVIAGFDSYGEGTAIAKAAEDVSMIPSDQYFLTLDADGQSVSSDFYLRLAGAAARMLQGGEPSRDVPVPLRAERWPGALARAAEQR